MSNGDGGEQTKSSEAQAVVELMKMVEPITSAVKDGPVGVVLLLDDMGIADELLGQDASALYDEIEGTVTTNAEQIDKGIKSIVNDIDAVDDIDGLHDIDEVDWETVFEEVDVWDTLDALKSIVGAVKSIFGVTKTLQQIEVQDPDMGTLGDMVLDFLLVGYLRRHHGEFYGFCRVFGVIESRKGDSGRPEEIKLGEIVDALEDPNGIPKELFQWAKKSQPFLVGLLLEELLQVFWGRNIPAQLPGTSQDEMKALTGVDDTTKLDGSKMEGGGQQLMVPLFGATFNDDTQFETGLKLVALPPAESDDFLPGLALVTYGTLEAGMEATLADDTTISVEGDGHLANRGVAVNPAIDSGLNFDFVNVEGTDASTPAGKQEDHLVFTITVAYAPDTPVAQGTILGTMAGQVDVDGLAFTLQFEYANDEFSLVAEANTTGVISIDPQGGFLGKVIPKPIEYEFDLTLGWSSKTGFYLHDGGTLMISLADNIKLGPLEIKETFAGLDIGDLTGEGGDGAGSSGGSGPPSIPLVFAATPALDIGFMNAQVMRTGVKADLSFPGGDEGNLGPANIDVGFKPPKGLALGVDAGPVSGGGMLLFYPEENRYAGALQLSIKQLSLTAVGLLKTELPGGEDGYSFLLLITAEFPPVQLGFGFTLNGVGGLFGLHRGMKTKVLGKKIRSGNVGSVLFPEDVIENAQRIISDLRAIFPPKKDVHVVGPMVKMGWGTPTLLTMEIGVILELPTFEIAIVGAFHFNLPDEAAPLITINLAVLGVIDIPDQRLAITASLYDSRIVMWTVSGDMAMRLRWGDDSKFMLSIGGFHPRYDPPKGFPELDRIKASMSPPGVNASLEYTGYLATTPNTFQVGAGVKAHAEAGPAVVDGQLAFDALFQFNPFKFIIDFLARFAVKIKGHGLEVEIDGTLMGPGPMRVKGTVHIEILFLSITAKVDVKMGSGGDEEEPPRAKVMPKLTTELGKSGNWAAQVPDAASSLASIRDSEREKSKREESGGGGGAGGGDSESEEVLAHPLGGIGVRQTVVPLEDRIEKFGNMVPRDYEEFRITEITVDGDPLDANGKREKFAPADYKKMSDSEKMNAPSFERQQAGKEAGADRVYFPGNSDATSGRAEELRRTAQLAYETSVVDERRETHGASLGRLGGFDRTHPDAARFGLPAAKVPAILDDAAIAQRPLRERILEPAEPVYGVPGGTVIGEREGRILPEETVRRIQVGGGRLGETRPEGGRVGGPASGPSGSVETQPGADGDVNGGGDEVEAFDGRTKIDAEMAEFDEMDERLADIDGKGQINIGGQQ
jgi:hypothetical protein